MTIKKRDIFRLLLIPMPDGVRGFTGNEASAERNCQVMAKQEPR